MVSSKYRASVAGTSEIVIIFLRGINFLAKEFALKNLKIIMIAMGNVDQPWSSGHIEMS